MLPQLSLMQLFQVGAHRGSSKSKLNPKLKSSVYGVENGLCLINLVETNKSIQTAANLIRTLGMKKRQILVVGTSKHLQNLTVSTAAKFVSPAPYVNFRWLGGSLTNWSTIKKTLKTLEKLENIENNKEFFQKLTRNERLAIQRDKTKISRFFSGLVNLKNNKPGALLVLDVANHSVPILEAQKMGIPVIALTSTASKFLPEKLDTTIVTNIFSIKAVELILDNLVESYNEGYQAGITQAITEEKKEVAMKN